MTNFSTSSKSTSLNRQQRRGSGKSKLKFLFMIASLLAFFSLISSAMAGNTERTFIMVKPDGVQRGLVGKIIERFEQKGFKLVAMKFMWASKELLEKHYADLSARPFFPGLVNYMSSGPVVPMVWEGLNVVKTGRQMLGATNPADSMPGTIRGDYCIQVGRNIIHGSDAVESANKEIALWFKEDELVNWKPAAVDWVYE
ncbi:nucleoside diphosphate kinase [Musca autumnalis]|uniref:nucleoside diphosphate kinase n=1 Tax=Musca autumnalis TaxID=221902 RepID=UPI003CED43F8